MTFPRIADAVVLMTFTFRVFLADVFIGRSETVNATTQARNKIPAKRRKKKKKRIVIIL